MCVFVDFFFVSFLMQAVCWTLRRGKTLLLWPNKKKPTAPSTKDQKLKVVAEVAPSKDKKTSSGLVFKRKQKVDEASPFLMTQMAELPPTGTFHLALPLLATLSCKRAEGKVPQRKTN